MSFFHLRNCQDKHFHDQYPSQNPDLYFRVFRKHDLNYRKRCECCYLKFIEETCFGHPYQGYATEDDMIWICTECAPHYAKGLILHGAPKRPFSEAPSENPKIESISDSDSSTSDSA